VIYWQFGTPGKRNSPALTSLCENSIPQAATAVRAASIFNTQKPAGKKAADSNTLVQENTILTPICGEIPTVKSPLF
jgi:hypothetical protein